MCLLRIIRLCARVNKLTTRKLRNTRQTENFLYFFVFRPQLKFNDDENSSANREELIFLIDSRNSHGKVVIRTKELNFLASGSAVC